MDTIPGDNPMENPPHTPLAGLDPADLLRQGVAEDTIMDGATSFNPPPIEELAPLFPQFEILELIGKGGMGAVYKVRQKDLDRIVALKILPPAIGQSPAFSSRFTREAKALAKLNHPGIVTIHEFGQQDGLYFILMEFVDGVNLAQLMKTGRVSPREALAIVPQICDALQYAHDQGIVHRDIKPENILLDRLGRVKVADFGIAKVVAAASEDPIRSGDTPVPTDATLAGKVIGTPQYMAPEQIDHPSEVDHRADIYALGVVFYQMLTGELPGKDLQAPSRKVHIDVRLDEIVLQALEKKPELRYQTAGEFRTQVQTIAAEGSSGEVPAAASRDWRAVNASGNAALNDTAPGKSSTRRAIAIAIGCGVLALGGVVVISLGFVMPFILRKSSEASHERFMSVQEQESAMLTRRAKMIEATVSNEAGSKLADYNWNELAANGRLGEAVSASMDGRICLIIENPNDAPMTTRLLTIEKPPIRAMRYAIQGEIRYGNVQGRGYLEMWSEFSGGRYFSRTLGTTGPTSVLTGKSGWREFTLPFDRTGTAGAPGRIEINLHLPGRGWVFVGPLKLIEFPSEVASTRHAGSPPTIISGESQESAKARSELEKAIRTQEKKVNAFKKRLEEIRSKTPDSADPAAMSSANPEYVDAKMNVETHTALLDAMHAKWEEVAGIPWHEPPAADQIDEIPSITLPSSNRLQLRMVAPNDPQAGDVIQIREDGARVPLKLDDNVIVCDRHVIEADIRSSSDAYEIEIALNETGEKRLAAATKGADGTMRLAVLVDGEVKSAPVVMNQLGRKFAVDGFRDQDKCLGIVRDLVDWPDDRDTSAMMEWVEKIDQGKAGEAWTLASEYLRQNLSSEKFVKMTAKARQPLGSFETRRLSSAKRMDSPPGAPDGLYLVSEFDTSFANKKEAKELVTLQKEKDGHWRICGYFIQ